MGGPGPNTFDALGALERWVRMAPLRTHSGVALRNGLVDRRGRSVRTHRSLSIGIWRHQRRAQLQLRSSLAVLALAGFATVGILLALILSRRLSPSSRSFLVPTAASFATGFGLCTGGSFSRASRRPRAWRRFRVRHSLFRRHDRRRDVDPIVDRLLSGVGTRPTRIVMGRRCWRCSCTSTDPAR